MKILYFFLYLWVIFALLEPHPFPATQVNADPCGTGSTTLKIIILPTVPTPDLPLCVSQDVLLRGQRELPGGDEHAIAAAGHPHAQPGAGQHQAQHHPPLPGPRPCRLPDRGGAVALLLQQLFYQPVLFETAHGRGVGYRLELLMYSLCEWLKFSDFYICQEFVFLKENLHTHKNGGSCFPLREFSTTTGRQLFFPESGSGESGSGEPRGGVPAHAGARTARLQHAACTRPCCWAQLWSLSEKKGTFTGTCLPDEIHPSSFFSRLL